jgi:uncharacterized protein (DUF362 family)
LTGEKILENSNQITTIFKSKGTSKNSMAKGVSIKFRSYEDTIPRLLSLIKFDKELKNHNKVILKPFLGLEAEKNTPVEFTEQVLKFCLANRNPETEIFIAEGADGADTLSLFEQAGYSRLAEQYSIGLVDLNNTEVDEILDGEFLKFDRIMYPKILSEGFIVSLPKLAEDSGAEMIGALSIMTGAFPAKYYKGIFTSKKSKIRKWAIKFSIHDILRCKMPEFAIIDAAEKGVIFAGVPFEMDQQAAKLLGKDWKGVSHLRLVNDSIMNEGKKEKTEVKEGE